MVVGADLPPLEKGDRVTRPRAFDPDDVRVGTVIERYHPIPSHVHPKDWMYAVEWDGGWIERGYLRIGLNKITELTVIAPTAVVREK